MIYVLFLKQISSILLTNCFMKCKTRSRLSLVELAVKAVYKLIGEYCVYARRMIIFYENRWLEQKVQEMITQMSTKSVKNIITC